jgi:hypothetical protein
MASLLIVHKSYNNKTQTALEKIKHNILAKESGLDWGEVSAFESKDFQ